MHPIVIHQLSSANKLENPEQQEGRWGETSVVFDYFRDPGIEELNDRWIFSIDIRQ
jgi:hypothetical protein